MFYKIMAESILKVIKDIKLEIVSYLFKQENNNRKQRKILKHIICKFMKMKGKGHSGEKSDYMQV